MKNLRCKNCGETTLAKDLLQDKAGDFIFCPTCEGTKFIVIGTENEEIDTLYVEEEEEEEEVEMVDCTCIHCGDDFEAEEEEVEVCEDCQGILDNADNPELIIALAEEFGCDLSDIEDRYEGEFVIAGSDYLVLTDDEADDKVAENIEDSLWAFNPNFLSTVTGVDSEVFEAIQANDRCEGNNDAILSIISATNTDMGDVAREAVSWDGRGHFLSQYDGHEIEVSLEDETYYCYRN